MKVCKKTFPLLLGVAFGLLISQLSLITRFESVSDGPEEENARSRLNARHQTFRSEKLSAPINGSLRYRHLAKELAPRRLLLVGVVTARRYLATRARGIYSTWAKDVILDVLFYTGRIQDGSSSAPELPIVSLPDVEDDQYPPQRKVFAMLRHMFEHHIDTYDFFMRADDDVYVKPDRLLELLKDVNPAQDIYMGSPGFGRERDQDRIRLGGGGVDRYCMGGPGVVFSRSALRSLAPRLNECLSDVVLSYNEDVEVGRCVHRMLSIQCTWAWETLWLFWTDYNGTLMSDKLYTSEEVKAAITLHPIKDPNVMLQVHVYSQRLRMQSLLRNAASVQADLVHTAHLLPANMNVFGNRDWLWYRVGTNSHSRHNLATWGYFNSTTLISSCSHHPASGLPLSHTTGINMALEVLLTAMEADGHGPFTPLYLFHEGFIALDPSSGVTYILSLSLQEAPSLRGSKYIARVFLPLLGPGLAHYQLASEILDPVLHVMVAVDIGDNMDKFLHMYYEVCLKKNTATHLHLVFLSNTTKSNTLMGLIQSYSKSITCYNTYGLTALDASSLVAKSLSDHTQLLLMQPHLSFTSEFLDHCRMNAIRGKQVFFPVPLSLYKREIAMKYLNHTPSLGFFMHHNYDVVCLHTSDYLANMPPTHLQDKLQVVDLLISSNLFVMRALEPYLFRQYEYGRCSTLEGQQRNDCILAQVEAIGSKKLLASFVAASYHLEWI